MPDEPEVIRQQMEETRSALAEKLESLEQQVAGTVTAATETVSAVTETVTSVKEAVQETVDSVKESLQETVTTVKQTFNLSAQVDRHPWLAVGGSVLAGFLAGRLLARIGRAPSRPAYLAAPEDYGLAGRPAPEYAEPSAERREKSEPGLLASLAQQYSGEITKLKALAIGTALGLVRDSLVGSAPEPLRPQLTDVMNSLTTKLGGETIHGPVLEHFAAVPGFQPATAGTRETTGPLGPLPQPGRGVEEWEGALS